MSATVINEAVMISPHESSPTTAPIPTSSSSNALNTNQNSSANSTTPEEEVESAMCDCCGLTEDCTQEYISRIRERYAGRWICGLCSEAVKEEIVRSAEKEERLISPEEAMTRCRKLRLAAKAEPDEDPTAHLIEALRHILRRSLDGRDGTRSTPASPMRGMDEVGDIKLPVLSRAGSCFPAFSS